MVKSTCCSFIEPHSIAHDRLLMVTFNSCFKGSYVVFCPQHASTHTLTYKHTRMHPPTHTYRDRERENNKS